MTIPARRIGNSILIHADCTQIGLPSLITAPPDQVAILTDPPYNFNASGGGKFRAKRKWMNDIKKNKLDTGFDVSILDPDIASHVMVFCHNDQIPDLTTYLKTRYDRVAILVWHKQNPVPFANRHYIADLEFIIHAWKRPSYPVGPIALRHRYFDDPPPAKRVHVTQKPITLIERLIKILPSKLIVDPFMGSGTTAIAAELHHRAFIGVESDPIWFDAAVKRVSLANEEFAL